MLHITARNDFPSSGLIRRTQKAIYFTTALQVLELSLQKLIYIYIYIYIYIMPEMYNIKFIKR